MALERHHLPNCNQASLLTKTSWDSERSTSTWEGAPVVHPENWAAGTGKAISRSDRARQTPELLGPGKGTKHRPNQSVPLGTTGVPNPEWLRLRRCMQPRAGLRQFPAEQPRAWVVCAVSGGRPSVAEALRAHASVICLQHPSLPTGWLKKWA